MVTLNILTVKKKEKINRKTNLYHFFLSEIQQYGCEDGRWQEIIGESEIREGE